MSMAHITSGKDSPQAVGTPDSLVAYINGQVRLVRDLAAQEGLTLCPDFFTEEDNALERAWDIIGTSPNVFRLIESDEWQWCNPPYNKLRPWYEKFARVASMPDPPKFLTLTPVAMGRSYFRDIVEGANCWPRPMVGRIKFKGYKNSAGGDSMLTIWDGKPYREPRTLDWRNGQGLYER